MKKIIILLLIFSSISLNAQGLNDYKFALVPERFSIFKVKNQYRLSTLTKMYMQKYGFETFYDSEEQPLEFSNVNCNKVYVDLIEKNTLFLTRIAVVIKDCHGKVLATSKMISSRDKDIGKAYPAVLIEAFETFVELKNYKYAGGSSTSVVSNEVKYSKVEENELVQEKVATTQLATNLVHQLYAQPIVNGYQLVDAEPKIIMKIYKTSAKDFFTAVKGELQGALVSKNGEWFFEYYKDDVLVSEKIDVKF